MRNYEISFPKVKLKKVSLFVVNILETVLLNEKVVRVIDRISQDQVAINSALRVDEIDEN